MNVAKNGDSLVVDVNDRDEIVHVAVPLATLRSAANIVAESGGVQ